MNKKLLKFDTLFLGVGIILYILISISNSIFGNYNLIVSIIFTGLSIATAIFFMVISYKNVETVNFLNIVIPIICFVVLFIIYFIPMFGFVESKGVHNGISILLEFSFGARYLICLSYFLKFRSRNVMLNISKNALNSTYNPYKFIYYFAIFLFVISIIAAIFNAFCHVIYIGSIISMLS